MVQVASRIATRQVQILALSGLWSLLGHPDIRKGLKVIGLLWLLDAAPIEVRLSGDVSEPRGPEATS